jgi:DNA-binding transcriptional regulator YdaS (Cro superfamily)
MKSLHQTSDPSTPKVSATQAKYQRGVCRFCGCSGERCPVPEGQFGFRTCFWLDEEQTVCAGIPCMIEWEKEKKGIATSRVEPSEPLFTFFVAHHYRGIQSRIARRLGVSKSLVSQVANGHKRSARISSALAEESCRVDREIRSSVSRKPRIVLRCSIVLRSSHHENEFVYASGPDIIEFGGKEYALGTIAIGRPHMEAAS